VTDGQSWGKTVTTEKYEKMGVLTILTIANDQMVKSRSGFF
jgi:hypothetical protein